MATCLVALNAPAIADTTPRGQAIFESQCKRCHGAGPKSLKTDPEQLRDALKSVRKHRFVLSEDDLRELTDYLCNAR